MNSFQSATGQVNDRADVHMHLSDQQWLRTVAACRVARLLVRLLGRVLVGPAHLCMIRPVLS